MQSDTQRFTRRLDTEATPSHVDLPIEMSVVGLLEDCYMDQVTITQYDPVWPSMFEQEAQAIRHALGDLLAGIEHIGSTSIPGLAAKPIIDILIATHSRAAWPLVIERLDKIGFSCWRGNTDPSRMFFAKGTPPYDVHRTHHAMLVEMNGHHWERLLLLRDYLRSHLEEARRYEALKRDAGEKFRDDRGAYTKAKGPYLDRIQELAKRERDQAKQGTAAIKSDPDPLAVTCDRAP